MQQHILLNITYCENGNIADEMFHLILNETIDVLNEPIPFVEMLGAQIFKENRNIEILSSSIITGFVTNN